MKNFSSIFGWILLAAVLAVPSLLFYNWWSANKAKEAQLAASQQGVPRDFFPVQEGSEARRAEPAPSASAEVPAPPAAAEASARQDAAPREVAAADKLPEPPARPEPRSAPPAAEPAAEDPAAAAGQQEPPPAAEARGETAEAPASYFKPATDRNPFFTPEDYARLRAEEYRLRQAARDRAREARQTPREVLVESRMTIQGIVGTNVIINGEMYSRGDTVMGAKIISIGANFIIGDHKGRRFRKYMQ